MTRAFTSRGRLGEALPDGYVPVPGSTCLFSNSIFTEANPHARSKIEVYLHYVWATKGREPLLTSEIEAIVYHCVQSEAQNMKCVVLALNGLPDHVHLLVKTTATTPPLSEFMKRIKGISSALVNDMPGCTALFRWQEGYGVHAVCVSHKQTALEYVRNQKQCHANGTTIADWEETDEEVL